MSQCTNIPSLTLVEDSKKGMNDVVSFAGSEEDQYISELDFQSKRTITGIQNLADQALVTLSNSLPTKIPTVDYGSGFIVSEPVNPNEYPVNQGVLYSSGGETAVYRFTGSESDLPYDLSQPFDESKWIDANVVQSFVVKSSDALDFTVSNGQSLFGPFLDSQGETIELLGVTAIIGGSTMAPGYGFTIVNNRTQVQLIDIPITSDTSVMFEINTLSSDKLQQQGGYSKPVNVDYDAFETIIQPQIDAGNGIFDLGDGNYHFNSSAYFDGLDSIGFYGKGQGRTVITSNQNQVPIRTSNVYPLGFVKRAVFRDITFDGQYDRTFGDFLYRDKTGKTFGAATGVSIAANYLEDDTYCEFQNVDFRRFIGLPIFIVGFRKVKLINCNGWKCRDLGLVNCGDVEVIGGNFEWGSDAAISASRGCQRLVVNSTVIKDCVASVLCRGFTVPQSGNIGVVGTTWDFNATVQLNRTSGVWDNTILGALVTVYDDQNKETAAKATFKIEIINDTGVAFARFIGPGDVPATIRNQTSSTWEYGPSKGPEEVNINGQFVGSFSNQFDMEEGPNRVILAGNSTRAGRYRDSESGQRCTVEIGKNVVTVEDSSIYGVGESVIIGDTVNYNDYHVAEVTAQPTATSIQISINSTRSYVNDEIYLIQKKTDPEDGHVAKVTANVNTDPVEYFDASGLKIFDCPTDAFHLEDCVNVCLSGTIYKGKFPVDVEPDYHLVDYREVHRPIQTLTITGVIFAEAQRTMVKLTQLDNALRAVTIANCGVGTTTTLLEAETTGGATVTYPRNSVGNIHTRKGV